MLNSISFLLVLFFKCLALLYIFNLYIFFMFMFKLYILNFFSVLIGFYSTAVFPTYLPEIKEIFLREDKFFCF